MSVKTERARDPYDGLRPWSAITHGIGAGMAVLASPLLLMRAYLSRLSGAVPAIAIYLATLIALYTASTLYHSLRTSVAGRLTLKKVDHLNIYLLIAGTYTPFCVLALRGVLGTALLATIWGLAAVGVLVTFVWIHLPRWLTSVIYIVMGWIVVFAFYPLSQTLSSFGLFWLFFGGGMYTVGGVLYAVKWPCRDKPRFGCHEIFHLFILLGSMAHFRAVWFTLA